MSISRDVRTNILLHLFFFLERLNAKFMFLVVYVYTSIYSPTRHVNISVQLIFILLILLLKNIVY